MLDLDRTAALLGAGAAAVALVALYRYRDNFNPASQNNLATKAADAVVHTITGGAAAGGEDSLGGLASRFREWVSGDDAKIRAMLDGAPPAGAPAGFVGYSEPGNGARDPLLDAYL